MLLAAVAGFITLVAGPLTTTATPISRHSINPENGGVNSVSSTLRSATIYRVGAELVHTAKASLRQGNNELVIDDISNNVDINSIQIGSTGHVTVLSVEFSKEYTKPETLSPLTRKWRDSLETVQRELEKVNVLIHADMDLLDLLTSNKKLGGTQSGLSVAELVKMMDYYKQKSLELNAELAAGNTKAGRLKETVGKLEAQIEEEEKKNTKTSGRLLLQLLSPQAGEVEFTISYLTPTAWWSPSYDLRVDNITEPLKLAYKAKLMQTSGIDWKQVKLTLSTSIPNQGGNAPILKTWFLHYVDPFTPSAAYNSNGFFKSNTLQSPLAALDGRVQGMQLNESVVAGYGSVKIRGQATMDKASPLGDYVSVNDNAMNVTFDIDVPYDVPTNGKEQNVVLKEYTVPSTYQYYAVPRIDKDAYLLGEIPDWEKLNLLPGEANLIFEGTYIGQSVIDPASIQDTMNLTLGRDKRVVVRREKVVDYSSVKFLGNNKKQTFTYEITVKNNKKEKIQLLLKDQYPISTSKDIEGELLDSSGAEVNTETGVLTWKLQLAPGESKKFRLSYSLKCPKDKVVNY